jgi:hypothetical protein
MGALTYLLGIAFGVIGLAVIDPLVNGSLAPIDQVAISVVFLPLVGAFLLAPVLVVLWVMTLSGILSLINGGELID